MLDSWWLNLHLGQHNRPKAVQKKQKQQQQKKIKNKPRNPDLQAEKLP